jgi:hypothetical protein
MIGRQSYAGWSYCYKAQQGQDEMVSAGAGRDGVSRGRTRWCQQGQDEMVSAGAGRDGVSRGRMRWCQQGQDEMVSA